MVDNIDLNTVYSLKFIDKWVSFNGDYRIIGVTIPDNVSDFEESYRLYTTYFVDLGYGLTEYSKYIGSNTKVYIATKVTGYGDVIEYETNKCYIPSSLIDFDNSDYIEEIYNYRLVANNIRRNFLDETEKEDFERNILPKLKEVLISNVQFTDPDISVQFAANKQFVSKSEAERVSKDYKKLYNETISKYEAEKKANEDYINSLKNIISFLNSKHTELYSLLMSHKSLVKSLLMNANDASISNDTGLDYIFSHIEPGMTDEAATKSKTILTDITTKANELLVNLNNFDEANLPLWTIGNRDSSKLNHKIIENKYLPEKYIIQSNGI